MTSPTFQFLEFSEFGKCVKERVSPAADFSTKRVACWHTAKLGIEKRVCQAAWNLQVQWRFVLEYQISFDLKPLRLILGAVVYEKMGCTALRRQLILFVRGNSLRQIFGFANVDRPPCGGDVFEREYVHGRRIGQIRIQTPNKCVIGPASSALKPYLIVAWRWKRKKVLERRFTTHSNSPLALVNRKFLTVYSAVSPPFNDILCLQLVYDGTLGRPECWPPEVAERRFFGASFGCVRVMKRGRVALKTWFAYQDSKKSPINEPAGNVRNASADAHRPAVLADSMIRRTGRLTFIFIPSMCFSASMSVRAYLPAKPTPLATIPTTKIASGSIAGKFSIPFVPRKVRVATAPPELVKKRYLKSASYRFCMWRIAKSSTSFVGGICGFANILFRFVSDVQCKWMIATLEAGRP